MLEFTDNKTESVITKEHQLSLERQGKILENQEAKLEHSEEAEEVKAWSEDIEAKLVKFEQLVNSMERITKEIQCKDGRGKQADLKFR